jgi:hypothetical protein
MESLFVLVGTALVLYVPYWIWGWPALVVVVALFIAFHIGYRVGAGKWMAPYEFR